MCGFAGILDFLSQTEESQLHERVSRMRDQLVHRGPDDAGTWIDAAAGIALGHRRLSIVDLSPSGHQPMFSGSGRYVVAFNGEIYNFRELRAELEQSCHFRGRSDTEVLLNAIDAWGVPRALARFNGMFAFALWDLQERCLYLARDRFGEKPLYYGLCADGALVFASELKALRAYPAFASELDQDSLAAFLRFTYVPAPNTIFRRVHKLPPASYVRVALPTDVASEPVQYWSMRRVVEAASASPFQGTVCEASTELDSVLRRAVSLRMVADVPLGAFLSGGIDSSTIVGIMQSLSDRPIKTFTIGFWEAAHNEAADAKAVAAHLGTEHTEHYVTPAEALDVIPRLPVLYDEPFADSSQIPTFLVSRVARGHVTVALSGDAGDELFCGYPRYPTASRAWGLMSRIPLTLRSGLCRLMGRAPDGAADRIVSGASFGRLSSGRLRSVAEVFGAKDADELYERLVSSWQDPAQALLNASGSSSAVLSQLRAARELPLIERMMLIDTLTYLPDDILTKVDRASMGVSLEARVPLLDPDVAAFAWRLPRAMKLSSSESKVVLRGVLERYVPRYLFERPKMGFGVPIAEWLRGPLRDWAEAQLDERRLKQQGLFRVEEIRTLWVAHLSGSRNWHRMLWPVLMFQAWSETK